MVDAISYASGSTHYRRRRSRNAAGPRRTNGRAVAAWPTKRTEKAFQSQGHGMSAWHFGCPGVVSNDCFLYLPIYRSCLPIISLRVTASSANLRIPSWSLSKPIASSSCAQRNADSLSMYECFSIGLAAWAFSYESLRSSFVWLFFSSSSSLGAIVRKSTPASSTISLVLRNDAPMTIVL